MSTHVKKTPIILDGSFYLSIGHRLDFPAGQNPHCFDPHNKSILIMKSHCQIDQKLEVYMV